MKSYHKVIKNTLGYPMYLYDEFKLNSDIKQNALLYVYRMPMERFYYNRYGSHMKIYMNSLHTINNFREILDLTNITFNNYFSSSHVLNHEHNDMIENVKNSDVSHLKNKNVIIAICHKTYDTNDDLEMLKKCRDKSSKHQVYNYKKYDNEYPYEVSLIKNKMEHGMRINVLNRVNAVFGDVLENGNLNLMQYSDYAIHSQRTKTFSFKCKDREIIDFIGTFILEKGEKLTVTKNVSNEDEFDE